MRVGVGKVFWGVTESRHLVDVVNQSDFVEDLDGEDKLCQPMLALTLKLVWGTFDLFVLLPFANVPSLGEMGACAVFRELTSMRRVTSHRLCKNTSTMRCVGRTYSARSMSVCRTLLAPAASRDCCLALIAKGPQCSVRITIRCSAAALMCKRRWARGC